MYHEYYLALYLINWAQERDRSAPSWGNGESSARLPNFCKSCCFLHWTAWWWWVQTATTYLKQVGILDFTVLYSVQYSTVNVLIFASHGAMYLRYSPVGAACSNKVSFSPIKKPFVIQFLSTQSQKDFTQFRYLYP